MPILILSTSGKHPSGGIEGPVFDRFLQLCFARATAFSLAKAPPPPGYEGIPSAVETMLTPYALRSLSPQRWFGYGSCCDPPLIETVYTANDSTREILRSSYRDLFLKNTKNVPITTLDSIGKLPKRASALSDLCFWVEKRMVLGTVSHELICATNQIDEDFALQLRQLASWQSVHAPDFLIDQISW